MWAIDGTNWPMFPCSSDHLPVSTWTQEIDVNIATRKDEADGRNNCSAESVINLATH
jgi:hypothetical protein